VFAGVSACPRCQGAWIAEATLDTAFGNPRWPPGQNMWWHAELECPECACEGLIKKMDARSASEVMVDVCPSHGLWLDQGELGRLMGLEDHVDELLELQKRVSAVAPDPDELAQRRLAWRSELDVRRRAASEFRAWVEMEQKRRAEADAAAAKERARQTEEERKQRRERAVEDQKTAASRAREAQARQRTLDDLAFRRGELLGKIRRIEAELVAKREELSKLQAELDTAKHEVREIEAQLETGEPRPK
jgi:Zn-finger nucleic acid-binding protein